MNDVFRLTAKEGLEAYDWDFSVAMMARAKGWMIFTIEVKRVTASKKPFVLGQPHAE